RKKFWYDSPTLGSKMIYKPTKLDALMKNEQTKTRREDNIRCRVLNGLIHKAMSQMVTTCEVSQEFYDLKLEICKANTFAFLQVSLSSNFSACRVYWNPAATMEKESYVESVLRKIAPRIRFNIGSLKCVAFMCLQVEDLLAIADFGPPEEEEEIFENDSSKLFSSATQSSGPPMRSNLFGIDHELLNKQIMDYKRLKVSRHIESIPWTEEQEQQLSKIQKKMKKRKPKNPDDDDITPQKYLLDKYDADYWDDNTESVSDYELEEEVKELEMDDGK
ncbi:hypothetical protein N305_01759, partial [Manacus vitellinus]